MEQIVHLKQLRIKKEELLLTLGEKKKIRSRSLLYLGIFVLLFAGMVTLDPNPNPVDAGNSDNELAVKFLKFIAGKFLVVSMYSGFRVYRANKEIRAPKKSEYVEMERKLRYLSNWEEKNIISYYLKNLSHILEMGFFKKHAIIISLVSQWHLQRMSKPQGDHQIRLSKSEWFQT